MRWLLLLVLAACKTSPADPCAPAGAPAVVLETPTGPYAARQPQDLLSARIVSPNGGDPYLFVDLRLRGLKAIRIPVRADLTSEGKLLAQAFESSRDGECQPDGSMLMRSFGLQLKGKKPDEVEGKPVELRVDVEDREGRKASASARGTLKVLPFTR